MSKFELTRAIEATRLHRKTRIPAGEPPLTIPAGAVIERLLEHADAASFTYLGEPYQCPLEQMRGAATPAETARELQTTVAIAAAVVGGAGIIVYSLQHLPDLLKVLSVASVAVMAAGASLLAGGFLGFLFGIPRILQPEHSSGTQPGAAAPGVEYRPSNSLEQISDWLTKILVGVGLTQLPAIRDQLQTMAGYLSQGLLSTPGSGAFAFALLTYFSVGGFLLGFLLTRLHLPGAYRLADVAALGKRIDQAERASKDALKKVEEQGELDARALTLVTRQLQPALGTPDPAPEELIKAVKAASPPVLVHIFSQAWEVRNANWETDKVKMARTIPVFRALIACDPQGKFHRNHAQLGYALKDQPDPAWAEAEAELTTAINIRGDWKVKGWTWYEFNRAECRIMQDPAFKANRPAQPQVRDKIADDLRVALRSEATRETALKHTVFQTWMDLNGLREADLLPSHRPKAQPQG